MRDCAVAGWIVQEGLLKILVWFGLFVFVRVA